MRQLYVAGVLGLAGCGPLEQLPALFDRHTPRERYEARLDQAGLLGTALARDWSEAGTLALRDAPLVQSPHAEQGYFAPSDPAAIALQVEARRGQQIVVTFSFTGDTTTLVFLDAWQVSADSAIDVRHVASADSGHRELIFAPREDGLYAIRVQPELLRGGRFSLEVRTQPRLAFPVRDARDGDIGGPFGAPRDGGARSHHGIDIFAPRGTPVLAAADGWVRRVDHTPRGGNVVWLRDEDGHSIYYAHLHAAAVMEGQVVRAGDTIGFVGNTGNAAGTPPHLHFGIYRRGDGPVDPRWYVVRPVRAAPVVTADTSLLGHWVRPPLNAVTVRAAPDARSPAVVSAPRHAPMVVVAAAGSWYRVRLPDGMTGYVSWRAVEPAVQPLETTALTDVRPVLARPGGPRFPSDIVSEAGVGDSVAVLGTYGGYRLVRTTGGVSGWVAGADATRSAEVGAAGSGGGGRG